jgi:polyhydroxyalkanoate depolymerase
VPSTRGEARPRSIYWRKSVAAHGLSAIASALCPLVTLGGGRDVYPGFLQLTGFMAMNIDRHIVANLEFGDGDSARKHSEFYDEYRSVMDLPAEFYLQTVDTVFVKHALPKGEMKHRGAPVDLSAIRRVGLLTVEGENDDISGIGQTLAAQTRSVISECSTVHVSVTRSCPASGNSMPRFKEVDERPRPDQMSPFDREALCAQTQRQIE